MARFASVARIVINAPALELGPFKGQWKALQEDQFNLEKPAAELVAYLSQGPPLYELPLADVRKAVDGAQAGDAVPMPDVEEAWFTVPAEVGDVRVLIITPRGAEAQLPVVLYMHGGGWILGSALSHGRLARELAVAADAAVAFIDYALAPEARYPVQIEQRSDEPGRLDVPPRVRQGTLHGTLLMDVFNVLSGSAPHCERPHSTHPR